MSWADQGKIEGEVPAHPDRRLRPGTWLCDCGRAVPAPQPCNVCGALMIDPWGGNEEDVGEMSDEEYQQALDDLGDYYEYEAETEDGEDIYEEDL